MTDTSGRTVVDAAVLGGVAFFVQTLFGVELQTLACAFVGAWIGAPLARRLEAPGDVDAPLPSFPEKARRALSALASYCAAAVASAVFATWLADSPTTSPGVVGLRNALSVGIGIGFYVLIAKFIEDPWGALSKLFSWLPQRPPGSGGPKP